MGRGRALPWRVVFELVTQSGKRSEWMSENHGCRSRSIAYPGAAESRGLAMSERGVLGVRFAFRWLKANRTVAWGTAPGGVSPHRPVG